MVTEISSPCELFPEHLPVRGEVTAWILTLVVLVTVMIVQASGLPWAGAGLILASIFALAAGSISLGNWMDRSTVIRLDHVGVRYTNGVRHTTLAWDEIQAVRVLPAQWGALQVQVIGQSPRGKVHFEFRTLGTVKYQGKERGRTGFAEGDQILEMILRMARMHPVQSDRPSYSYYARK